MANSVDPDQTAPSGAVWSGSTLFAYEILSDTLVYAILGHLPYLSTYEHWSSVHISQMKSSVFFFLCLYLFFFSQEKNVVGTRKWPPGNVFLMSTH